MQVQPFLFLSQVADIEWWWIIGGLTRKLTSIPTLYPPFNKLYSNFLGLLFLRYWTGIQLTFRLRLPLTVSKWQPFGTLFELYQFNRLPMGICVGCQGLSWTGDGIFADLQGMYMFNFMDNLMVSSPSMAEYYHQLRQVLQRLQPAGFALNKDKLVLGV